MARERMITRTITSVVCEVMTVTLENKTVSVLSIEIPSGNTLNADELEKAIKAALPDGTLFVQIMDKSERETLYGMSEADFIRHASVLPARS